MEYIIPLFLVLTSLISSVGSQRKDFDQGDGGLSFLAVGDAGGYQYYPYFTKTLKKVAKQMGKVLYMSCINYVIQDSNYLFRNFIVLALFKRQKMPINNTGPRAQI